MNSKRAYYLMCGLVVLFVVAIIGGAYEINGVLGKQSNNLVNTKAKLTALSQEQVELAQAKKDIATYSDLYKISRVVVPESKNQTETVRQIIKLANASGVTIQQISFPPSTLGNGPSGAKTPTTAPATVGPSATTGVNASLSQLQKVTNIPGVYVLQLTVIGATNAKGSGGYPQLISFLAALEQNRLTALVNTITITPGTATSSSGSSATSNLFTFSLTLDAYIKP
jgi:hypothetical protein